MCISEIAATGEPETLLLDERQLMGFVNETKDEEIKVTNQAGEIVISDSEQQTSFQFEDPANFPSINDLPQAQGGFLLSDQVIAGISIARNFLSDLVSAANFKAVCVNASTISAFQGAYFYLNQQFSDLPLFLLTKDQADIVTGLKYVLHKTVGNKEFFFSGDSIYIFNQQEFKPHAIGTIPDRLKAEGKEFKVKKQPVVSFLNMANIASVSETSKCEMTLAGETLQLRMKDANYARGADRDVRITGSLEDFTFDSKLIASAFKSIPYEDLNCKTNQNCLIISGEAEWFCFIGMQK